MKLQSNIPLANIYKREEEFSADLASNLSALKVGAFEDAEVEARVGTRRADIVATGDSGALVVENQFGRADWDHWGRLEAYARLREARIAVLVAESFEELMIVTCDLRNEDSEIDWYLIQAMANTHQELSFHHVAFPAIDIQTERAGNEFSEFWQPIRSAGLFAGKPVPIRDEGWINKSIRGIDMNLRLNNRSCTVVLYIKGPDRTDRQRAVAALFESFPINFVVQESSKSISMAFPVLEKGKLDHDDWPEIRERLVVVGTEVYRILERSGV
ncbi:hypothetical protein [Stieleria varia]|uniref:DUF5655 domain-containing protein n=1 Tax=Stieleria varia TaxID=2528005 RepID=A0A5C6AT21_9BACT|nr:hypothetical protein [Stieleria varia]TWU02860.1 hypothetical protein Pla52n_39200 [Stieleria varia]